MVLRFLGAMWQLMRFGLHLVMDSISEQGLGFVEFVGFESSFRHECHAGCETDLT